MGIMRLIRHTGIYVHDLDKMKAFYCKHFEMEEQVHCRDQGTYIETVLNRPGVVVELCKLRCKDGSMLELLQPHRGNAINAYSEQIINYGCVHIAFTVSNAEQKYAELRQDCCTALSLPQVSPDGYAKVFFCKDPEGNYLEVVEEL